MNKNTIIAIVVAIVVLAVIVALIVVFGTGSSDSKTTPTPTPDIEPFGTGGEGIAIDTDGTNWVAVGQADPDNTSAGTILYSTNDGQTWTKALMDNSSQPFGATGGYGNAIHHAGTSWKVVGHNELGNNDSGNILRSDDSGKTWIKDLMFDTGTSPFGNEGEGNAIYSDGTSWVAVGNNNDNTNSSNIVYYTTDEWHSAHMDDGTQPFGDTGWGYAIHHAGSSWVAVGTPLTPSDAGTILYSTDGASWSKALMAGSGTQPFGATGGGGYTPQRNKLGSCWC